MRLTRVFVDAPLAPGPAVEGDPVALEDLVAAHAHGTEGVHFFTRGKVVTTRWIDPANRSLGDPSILVWCA